MTCAPLPLCPLPFAKQHPAKMKGVANVRLADGTKCDAEIHWFEAHGVGKKDFKIKRIIR
jgi:hypothetical protein